MIVFKVEVEREEDGRWLAEVLELPGVLAYGQSQDAAVSKVVPPEMLRSWTRFVRHSA